MARPTREQIRTFLDDHGLSQVDPNQWFRGVFPEIMQVAVSLSDLGGQGWNRDTSESLTIDAVGTISQAAHAGAQPGEIQVIQAVSLEFFVGNLTEEMVINKTNVLPSGNMEIYGEGSPGGPSFGVGRFWGTDNTRTNRIATYFPMILDGDRNQQITVQALTGAALRHHFNIKFISIVYSKPVGFLF